MHVNMNLNWILDGFQISRLGYSTCYAGPLSGRFVVVGHGDGIGEGSLPEIPVGD